MAADPGRLEVGEVGECGQNDIEPVGPDGGDGFRLTSQRGLPLVPAVELGEDVESDPLEGIDHRRVVRPPSSFAHPLVWVGVESGCEIGVSRHGGDAYRQRYGGPFESVGIPLPVPALVGVGEGVDDRLLQTDASGQHGADLAVHGQRAFSGLRIGEPASDEPQSPHPGLAGGDAAHVSSEHLPARAHEDRSHRGVVGPLVATYHGGGLRRIRRATQEAEERELVDGADVVRAASHRLGEGGGDRAGAQRVAERLTGPEIRRERHRGEELGQTERSGQGWLVRADHER